MKKIYLAKASYAANYSVAFANKKNAEIAVSALGGDKYGIVSVPILDMPTGIKGAMGTAMELEEWGGADEGE